MAHVAAKHRNRLLTTLRKRDLDLLAPDLERAELRRGEVLFAAGEDVTRAVFPDRPTVAALVLELPEGDSAEAAMIGWEGAVGGIISAGAKPAFGHGVVQVAGAGSRLPLDALESAKLRSASLRDHFERYADCLLAQVLQTVACNTAHDADARLARWLLALEDRVGAADLPITQEFMARMLGVRRPYLSKVLRRLEERGAIARSRGRVLIVSRRRLAGQACECYDEVRRHFDRLLPGLYATS